MKAGLHPKTTYNILIIGAGMSGLYSAALFASRGHQVTLLEKRKDPRDINSGPHQGRSINFTLSYRGLLSLEKIGLRQAAIENSVEVKSRQVHLPEGGLSEQSYNSTSESGLYSITRETLGHLLLKKASSFQNVEIIFDAQNVEIDRDSAEVSFNKTDASGVNHTTKMQPDFIIGADGVFSTARAAIQKNIEAEFKHEVFPWVYKEFTLTQDQFKKAGLKFDAVNIWGRDPALLIGLPNSTGTLTCNLIIPAEGDVSPKSFEDNLTFEKYLAKNFSQLKDYSKEMVQQMLPYAWSKIYVMSTKPWSYQDKIVLVGDACHAVVHFYAQGLNSSLEDCLILADTIEQSNQHSKNLSEAFRTYQENRKKHTDSLSQLSLQNFQVLMNRSTLPTFEARTRIEGYLTKATRGLWRSQYSLVAHSNTPYGEIQKISQIQNVVWNVSGLNLLQASMGLGISMNRWIATKAQKTGESRAHERA